MNEIERCKSDPCYFIDNYVKIKTLNSNTIPFKLHDFQRKLINDFQNEKYVVNVKARNVGMTWLQTAWSLYKAMHNDKHNVLYIAHNRHSAFRIMKRLQFMYNSISNPSTTVFGFNERKMEFNNGSQIVVKTFTRNTRQLDAIDTLILDEAAFFNDLKYTLTYLSSILTPDRTVVITSTPHKLNDDFHNVVQNIGMISGKLNRLPITVYPGANMQWIKNAIQSNTYTQEYLAEFPVMPQARNIYDELDKILAS
jgi:phage FluMu gp28-like protein